MGRRASLVLVAMALWALFLSGCAGARVERLPSGSRLFDPSRQGITATEIVIGSASALSGHASFLGTQLNRGAQAYFEEVNRQGGVHNRKIRLVLADDMYEPVHAVRETQKLLVEKEVFILFNYVGTPTAEAVLPLVNGARVPLVGVFTGAEFLRHPHQPYVFNIRASYNQETAVMVEAWLAQGKDDIAVFYQDDSFGLAVLSGTALALQKYGKEPVALASFPRGEAPSWQAVRTIVNANPDAVVMVGTYSALAQFVAMAKEAGLTEAEYYTVSFVGSEALAGELSQYPPEIGENVIITQVVPDPFDDSLPVVREFQAAFRRHFPGEEFNYVALEGYINAKILVEALRRAGADLDREKLVQALESLSGYDVGAGLDITVSSSNHQMFNQVFLSRLVDGKFRTYR
ncbi:MAG TPA: ABC transporter substrate-binding protein [Clostridia bacterium]|nr:ABC transporter substrate-binding protein [Clostridia bacterium]